MNDDAVKVLKKLKYECPDCGERKLIVIMVKKPHNGIIYTEKMIICQECDYRTPFKKKNEKKLEFEDN